MDTVKLTVQLGIPAAAAWEVLADFPGFLKWAGGRHGDIEIEGHGVGMIRHMDIPGAGKMAERLDQLDHSRKTIGYSLVYGNPAGMREYRAIVTLEDIVEDGDTGCRINWHGEFTPAEGQRTDTVAGNLGAAYQGMSEALVKYVNDG